MIRPNFLLVIVISVFVSGCANIPARSAFSCFLGQKDFSHYKRAKTSNGDMVLTSPKLTSEIPWNELIISWNAAAAPGTCVKIEARALLPTRQTKFFTLAEWSSDNQVLPSVSVKGQRDADGDVDTDTLVLEQPARAAQIRVTLSETNGVRPSLKFLGTSFSNTKVLPARRSANQAAWGKTIPVPERSQHGYPRANGWCSPTSLSMVLAYWAEKMQRSEMNLTVPQVAEKVYDTQFGGTGNWPFNTAFAGSFPGMRSFVTRLDDIAEVEEWIAAGIPVILSARWDWLQPGRPTDAEGHLIVCIGFTKDGDVVVNDPATRFDRGEVVRRIYKRADVVRAWTKSHHAVYILYPEGAKIPANKFAHW